MASTKKAKTVPSKQEKQLVSKQIDQLIENLKTKFNQYERLHDQPYPIELVFKGDYDYVRPDHYKQVDGKETWERMIDKYGVEKTANFCELNAFKYQDRKGKKPGENIGTEEKKIDWYNNKANELYESISDYLKNRSDLEDLIKEVVKKNSKLENENNNLVETIRDLTKKVTDLESNTQLNNKQEKKEDEVEKNFSNSKVDPSISFIEKAKQINELYLKSKNQNNG